MPAKPWDLAFTRATAACAYRKSHLAEAVGA
jgi:hypothetical protein